MFHWQGSKQPVKGLYGQPHLFLYGLSLSYRGWAWITMALACAAFFAGIAKLAGAI